MSGIPLIDPIEPFKELRFHLKELHWDLTSLVKQVEALCAIAPDTPQSLRSIRYGLIDVTTGIEHDVSHHLAEALKLVGQVLESSLAQVGERLASLETDWDGEELPQLENVHDESIMLHIGLQALTPALSLALEGVDRIIIAVRGGEANTAEQLERELEQLVEVGSQAWLQSQQLYKQAFRLHRRADPVEAAREDYRQLMATPLQQEYHPDSRTFDSCPRCGAILAFDDRTFDGSYCEFCRTRWIESE